MQVNSVGATQVPSAGNDRFAKIKKAFDSLNEALQKGDLDSAKESLEQIQSAAPANQSANPLAEKLSALGDAIDSGDVSKAQELFTDIQQDIAKHRPPSGARGGGASPQGRPSGPPPGGHGPGGAGGSSASSSNKTYDPKDTNQDGKVSLQEQLAYATSESSNATLHSLTSSLSDPGQTSGFDAIA